MAVDYLSAINQSGSGLNITQIVDSLVEAEKAPQENQIQTKIDNIDKASVEGPLSTKRVSQGSRTSVPYDIISHLSLSNLQTHLPGIVIRMPFSKYEFIRDNLQSNELDSYLLRNIGGNETVSCFIYITKEDGYSGSGEQRIQYDRFKIEQEKNGWIPIYRRFGFHKNTYLQCNSLHATDLILTKVYRFPKCGIVEAVLLS